MQSGANTTPPPALHAASSYPGAQLYMECAQLQITGGGSAQPATVSFPGAYQGTDPGKEPFAKSSCNL